MTAFAERLENDTGEFASLPIAVIRPLSLWRRFLLRLLLFTAAGMVAGLIAGWLAREAPRVSKIAAATTAGCAQPFVA